MTTEQKLHAIVERQVAGKYTMWQLWLLRDSCGVSTDGTWWAKTHQEPGDELPEWSNMSFHTLQILLDPEGLKSAYGKGPAFRADTGDEKKDILLNAAIDHLNKQGGGVTKWLYAAHAIFFTWIDSNGDAEKTIETAYSLLPQQ